LYQRVNELIQGARRSTRISHPKNPEAVAGFIENVETVRRNLKTRSYRPGRLRLCRWRRRGSSCVREVVEFPPLVRKDGDRSMRSRIETIVSGSSRILRNVGHGAACPRISTTPRVDGISISTSRPFTALGKGTAATHRDKPGTEHHSRSVQEDRSSSVATYRTLQRSGPESSQAGPANSRRG
jgi:hypothetical protein